MNNTDDTINETDLWRENSSHDCDNLEFKTRKVVFYPKDIEKMKKMDEDEQLEFMAYLKREGRYTLE